MAGEPTGRGSAGRQLYDRVMTYDRVRALLAAGDGITTREALERVAAETGRSVGAVQNAYYRVARSDPTSGVQHRPRRGAAPGRTVRRRRTASPTPSDGARLVEGFLDAQQALLDYVKELEADRRRLAAIRAVLR